MLSQSRNSTLGSHLPPTTDSTLVDISVFLPRALVAAVVWRSCTTRSLNWLVRLVTGMAALFVASCPLRSIISRFVISMVPNDGTPFFETLGAFVEPDTPAVLCGDFNTVVDAQLDCFGCNPDSPCAYTWPHSLAELVDGLDQHDVWRLQHPNTREYTGDDPVELKHRAWTCFGYRPFFYHSSCEWKFYRFSDPITLMSIYN